MKKIILLCLVFLTTKTLLGCPVGSTTLTKAETDKLKKQWEVKDTDRTVAGQNSMPWGGPLDSKWEPEAILANSAAAELNEAFKIPYLRVAIVAVPVKFLYSNVRPYGDGQSNAAISFNDWDKTSPPVTGTFTIDYTSQRKVKFKFHSSIKLDDHVLIRYRTSDKKEKTDRWTVDQRTHSVSWTVPEMLMLGNLYENDVVFIKSESWEDWFVFDFRMPVLNIDSLKALPKEKTLGDGRPIIDPENIRFQADRPKELPILKLLSKKFTPESGYNTSPYVIPDVHAQFPGKGNRAVGQGWTWVINKPQAPFKMLYTCFDSRQPDAEAKLGVPSGGGWHEIGDPAETLINSLENAPILVGYGNGKPAPQTPSGKFSYGLTDIATIAWLKPGTGLMTSAGKMTIAENADGYKNRGKGGPEGRNYHWFLFSNSRPICTEEWVHPCIPERENSLGFKCK